MKQEADVANRLKLAQAVALEQKNIQEAAEFEQRKQPAVVRARSTPLSAIRTTPTVDVDVDDEAADGDSDSCGSISRLLSVPRTTRNSNNDDMTRDI